MLMDDLFFIACGKPSKYRSRNDQVLDAYWLISMLQGVNMTSLMFLLAALLSFKLKSGWLGVILFISPLIFNYFFFLKRGNKFIIDSVDKKIDQKKLKPKSYIWMYLFYNIELQAGSELVYRYMVY